jgi:hypothetical protein
VVGVIAAVTILALGLFWLRRRAGQKQLVPADPVKLSEMPPRYLVEMDGSNPTSRL